MRKKLEKTFLELVELEKKLEITKKIHAKKAIARISKQIEEEEKQATVMKKIYWIIKDWFSSLKLKKIKKRHNMKVGILTAEDKNDEIINEKKLKKGKFILTINLKRYFEQCRLYDDCGSIDISNIKYDVSLVIDYNNIYSKPHYEKTFENEEDALKYYNTLVKKYQNQEINDILSEIIENTNNKIDKLEKYLSSDY